MKKLKCYLVLLALVAFMASCVDIQEPQGIQDVRSAKVDFLKAHTALKLAESKLMEAEAATQAAVAKLKDAETQSIILQNAALQAKSEQEKAEFELKLKKLQADNQVYLQNVQTQIAQAQLAYQQAMADLDILKTVGIPSQYMDRLNTIKNELSSVMWQITQKENDILRENLSLNLYIARDSVTYDYTVKKKVADNTKQLKFYQDQLATFQQLKAADKNDLEAQKAIIAPKITAITIEIGNNQSQADALSLQFTDLKKEKNDREYDRYSKYTYSTSLTVPDAIKTAVYDNFKGSFAFSDDKITMSKTSSIDDITSRLLNLKNYVDGQKAANPGNEDWANFADNVVTKEYNSWIKTGDSLEATIATLDNEIGNKGVQLSSISNYLSTLKNYKDTYTNMLANVETGLTKYDQDIENANYWIASWQSQVNAANADLAAWQTGYGKDTWGNYTNQKAVFQQRIALYQNQLKDLKDRFDALTKQKDEMVKLINDYK